MGIASFVCMTAWGLLLPLFAGPDETSNFVKSAAVVRGELIGDDHPPSLDDSYFRTTVDIDRQFNAANWIPWCFATSPASPACDRPIDTTDPRDPAPWTSVGRYPPAAFVVPGLGTLIGPDDAAARLARILNAAVVAAFFGLAAGRLARSDLSSTTVLIALTPGVFFLGAVLSPSGVEIAAAFATWVFAGAALRPDRWSRSDEMAFALCVSALVLARPIGAVLAAIIVATTALSAGGRVALTKLVTAHRPTVGAGVLTAGFMVIWHVRVFAVHLDESVVTGEPAIGTIAVARQALRHLPQLYEQHVGNFGWLDTPSPTLVVWFFAATAALAVASAWRSLQAVERGALVALVGITVATSVYLDTDYYRLFHAFGAQGRHLSPLLVGVPVLAARGWRPSHRTTIAVSSGWFLALSVCAVEALRRYTVGAGSLGDMLADPVWTPTLGAIPSLALVVTATAAVALVSIDWPARAEQSSDVPR